MNVDEEGKELEKCMKMIAGRTIEKVYGERGAKKEITEDEGIRSRCEA